MSAPPAVTTNEDLRDAGVFLGDDDAELTPSVRMDIMHGEKHAGSRSADVALLPAGRRYCWLPLLVALALAWWYRPRSSTLTFTYRAGRRETAHPYALRELCVSPDVLELLDRIRARGEAAGGLLEGEAELERALIDWDGRVEAVQAAWRTVRWLRNVAGLVPT